MMIRITRIPDGDAHDQLANGIQTFQGLLCHNSDIGYYLANGATCRAISDREAMEIWEEYENATDAQRAAYEAAK